MDVRFQDQVRERAYQLWLQEGRVHGRAEQHWFQAERDLLPLDAVAGRRFVERTADRHGQVRDLRQAEQGWYDLLCLPLLLPGADGAPARAVLIPPTADQRW